MIEGRDTLMGTYDAMVQKIYDLLPADPECQRLFMKWKREFRAFAKSGWPVSRPVMDEVSATYFELKMNLELEGIQLL